MSAMNSTSDLRSSVNELISNIKSKSKSKSEAADIAEISPNGQYIRYNEILSEGEVGGGVVLLKSSSSSSTNTATAYKGFDQDYGREVTWNKVQDDDPSRKLLYSSEIQLLKSLKHDNIIKCFSSWVDVDDNKTINIITESFTSGSLRQFRQKHKSVDLKAIKNWARQILQGLNYLHTHNPPIIHRNLNCDNVFVNGCSAQVKLGYLGESVLVPEFYEEEYNDTVDIYSFGMCMLELVTCEWDHYPYTQSKNQPNEIYKNIALGINPAAPSIARLKNLEVKQFIEKCLVPPSLTLSAAELLENPFLSSQNSNLPNSVPTSLSNSNNVSSETMIQVIRKNSQVSSVGSCTEEVSNDMSSFPSSPSVTEKVPCNNELKMELDAIDMRYTQRFLQLMRMRDNEIDNAKNRWMSSN